MSYQTKEIYEFSRFRLEVYERKLLRDGKAVQLTDKAFDTLCVLVRRAGELVSKDELMATVWPDTVVEENNLDQKISMVRRALGEKARGKEKFIETVRGHGYRFLAEVVAVTDRSDSPNAGKPVKPIAFPESKTAGVSAPRKNVVSLAGYQPAQRARSIAALDEAGDSSRIGRAETDAPVALHLAESTPSRWPLRILALVLFVSVLSGVSYLIYINARSSPEAPAANSIQSVAVLPFENHSGNPDAEYISDGITESLINHLSQLPNLRVMSRSAVFRYKGKPQDTQVIGKELNVDAIVTGSVKQVGDQHVITVQLDHVQTARQMWGNQFVRQINDILGTQSAISREIAQNLSSRFSGEDLRLLDKAETTNPEAYELYVRGRYFWNKRNKESVEKAISHFRDAVALEPGFALGYVGLADSYIFLWDFADGRASEMLPKARAAVDRALQLDDSLAEAHATSGFIHRLNWEWNDAEREFQRSITLNPNYAPARIWFSIHLRNQKEFAVALNEMKKARELDPLSTVVGANMAYVLILTTEFESAIEQCNRTLELDPQAPVLHELTGVAYLKQGRVEEALPHFEKAAELSRRETSRYLSSLGHAYATAGRRADAMAILKELEDHYKDGSANGQNLAAVYVGLDDTNNALIWLERDFVVRAPLLAEINWRFAFDGIRGDPRFSDLVRRMNLTP